MNEYKIIITPDAEYDLNELDDYITFELLAPDVAINFISDIKEQIKSLNKAPKRFHLVEYEPWHSRNVRRMNVNSFAVFYYIDEDNSEIYIMNVLYQKRDIENIIKK